MRVVGVVATLCCVLLAAPSSAVASSRDEGVVTDAATYGLEVTVGFDGATTPGAWTPVEVEVAPERPVVGTLAVDARTWNGGIERRQLAIEVAGGARNVYRFVVPYGDVQVTLQEGSTSASVERRLAGQGSMFDGDFARGVAVGGGNVPFLVGHLGEVPSSAPTLQSEITGRQGTWVSVDPAWLGEPEALDSLDTLVAEASQLSGLSEAEGRALDTAVVRGLQLVVVTGGVDGGPPGWVIEEAGAVLAATEELGKGRIVRTSTAPTGSDRELWNQLVAPGETHGWSDWDVRNDPWRFGRVMAGSEGSVPTVPWFAAFLAAYILAVGPLNGIVLRRLGRQELAWVTVPAVTALFTAGVAVGSVGGNPIVGSASRIEWAVDGVGEELVVVAVRAPSAGVQTTTLPGSGWATSVLSHGGSAGASSVIGPVAQGTQVQVDLASLEVGGLVASRPTTAAPPLTVSAVATPDLLTVTVANVGTDTLEDIIVRAASAHRHLGSLAPGEETSVELSGSSLESVEPWFDPFNDLEDLGEPVAPPLSLEPLLRTGVMDGDPGLVWAVATSARATTDVDIDGAAVEDDGTLYAVGTRPTLPADGAVGPYAVARELVSGGGEYRPSPQTVEGTDQAVLRYRFPADGRIDVLSQDLERGAMFGNQLTLSVWDVVDRRWLTLADAFPAGRGDPARLVSPLGELHVRATGELFPFEFSGRSVAGGPAGGGAS